MSSGLIQVFVELENLHGILNYIPYLHYVPSRKHTVTVISIASLAFEGDNHLEVAGSILTAGK